VLGEFTLSVERIDIGAYLPVANIPSTAAVPAPLPETGDDAAVFSAVLAQAAETGEAEAEPAKTDLDRIFAEASARYGVPVNLLKAVAKAESGFRPDAVSPCGAEGIMQLMPATARGLGVTDSFDPEQNIMGGAQYLRDALSRFDGNVEYALAAYNAGPNAVVKYGGVPPYNETQNYVKTVLGYMGETITAPNVSVSNSVFVPTTKVRVTNPADKGGDLYSLLGGDAASLKEQMLMRILEMETDSGEEDDEKIF
jgi:hypothetical protein